MKKYGYVIEMRKTSFHYPGYYCNFQSSGSCEYACCWLRNAAVFKRGEAYSLRYDNETVRKVELFKSGKPKRVVSPRRRRCEAVTKDSKRCKRAWKDHGHRALCTQHTKMWDSNHFFTRKQSKRYV